MQFELQIKIINSTKDTIGCTITFCTFCGLYAMVIACLAIKFEVKCMGRVDH